MKHLIRPALKKFALAMLAASMVVSAAAETPKKLLVVTVTTGFRHSSIPTAEKVLAQLAKESGAFTVDFVQQPEGQPQAPKKPKEGATAEELARFKDDEKAYNLARGEWMKLVKQALTRLSPENLKNYDGVIFANTTGDLPIPDPQGFVDWVKSGKAFIGMHSATDTFHGFRPFIEMIGGEFQTHGPQVQVDCQNQDPKHPACKHLPNSWTVYDEIYIMKSFNRDTVHGLLGLDQHPNNKTPGDFPVAWCKEYGKGKVFYTSLGHREDIWDTNTPANFKRLNSNEVAAAYQKHILGGIKWALGLEPGDARPQTAKQ